MLSQQQSECTFEVSTGASGASASALILLTGAVGVLFALFLIKKVAAVVLDVKSTNTMLSTADAAVQNERLRELYDAIGLGEPARGLSYHASVYANGDSHSLPFQEPTRSFLPSTSCAPSLS